MIPTLNLRTLLIFSLQRFLRNFLIRKRWIRLVTGCHFINLFFLMTSTKVLASTNSVSKLFLNKVACSQENTGYGCFCNIFKNTLFAEHLWAGASVCPASFIITMNYYNKDTWVKIFKNGPSKISG